jgi:hypothetical protein
VVVVGLVARPAGAAPAGPSEDALRAARRSLAEEDWPAARARLEEAAAAHPEDCAVRAWLAWFEIESGRMDAAETLLGAGGCPVALEDRGRWALLRALGAERRDDARAVRDSLLAVGERQPLWPEDRAVVRTLSGRRLEGYTLPLEVRGEVALGATSNAFATSPTDAARREAPGSGVARPDLRFDLRAPEAGLTPSLELGARGYGISSPEAREQSHAELSVAAAVRLGRGGLRPTVRYRHDELLFDAAGGRYSAANEAEVELSPSGALTVVGGFGHRVFFTDDWRTRTEWNLAGLGATSLRHRPLVLGGAFRYYRAHRDVYDQVGGTLTAGGELPLRAALRARLAVSGAFDDFPRSGGVDGLVAFVRAHVRARAAVVHRGQRGASLLPLRRPPRAGLAPRRRPGQPLAGPERRGREPRGPPLPGPRGAIAPLGRLDASAAPSGRGPRRGLRVRRALTPGRAR